MVLSYSYSIEQELYEENDTMTQRATMSQVKFKVRYNALVLREFKVSDIVEATGLKPESVRTELQRMKAEGLLVAGPNNEHDGQAGTRRGAPPVVYRLTDDPERRVALSESVAAFYPAPPAADRPSSGAYRRSQQLLDRALNAKGRTRKQLLADAERALAHAGEAEGGEWAGEQVKAYLRYECARLRYLQSDYAAAKSEFAALRSVFATLGDDPQAQRAREFEVCADVHARFGTGSVLNKGAWARYLVHLTNNKNYHTDSPLTVLLLQMVSRLS